jgi:hypothetical protein
VSTIPLVDRRTGAVVGHLSEPVHIRDLKPGDVVWDDLNDEPAVFECWSNWQGCYILYWPSMRRDGRGGEFCAWDKDSSGQPHMWRRVVRTDQPNNTGPPDAAEIPAACR